MAELNVELRKGTGKYVAFNLRKEGKIPGVIYGAEMKENILLAVPLKELLLTVKAGSRILELNVEGKKEHVLLKGLQYGTYEWDVMHVDFIRVTDTTKIHLDIELEFKGEAPGTKVGGMVETVTHVVSVECLAKALPEKIVVDLSGLELHQVIYVKNLPQIAGLKYLADANSAVVSCHPPRAQAAAPVAEVVEVAAAPAASAAPAAAAKAPAKK